MQIRRTLWLIETRLGEPMTLVDLAADAGVSPAYLTRAFAFATGRPVMRYVWARRLTEAARALASAAPPSVLSAALDAGYASPEAFARAFRAAFGLCPRDLVSRGSLDGLPLTPALEFMAMTESLTLTAPVVEQMPDRRITGTLRRYDMTTRIQIPALWSEHMAAVGALPGADPERWFGVCANFGDDGGFDYLVGQETPRGGSAPDGLVTLTLPAGRWARFRHDGHVSEMAGVWSAIYRDWIGADRLAPRDGPSAEFYPPEFDGVTGRGGFEIWVPVA